MASLHNLAISLFRQDGQPDIAAALRHTAATTTGPYTPSVLHDEPGQISITQ
ncbi:hypothetical protein [Streptomyces sp. NPDC060035]|uniref:hypothetical protein n=1 Tax=Streptomyces sp. NPDC060035 TaxID=3347044 RepID=UPI0036B733B5